MVVYTAFVVFQSQRNEPVFNSNASFLSCAICMYYTKIIYKPQSFNNF